MTPTQSDLIRLLRCAVLGEPLPGDYAPKDGQELLALAKTHDLAHLVSFALREHGLLDPADAVGKEFDRQQMLAIWRVSVLEHDLAELRAAFEAAGAAFIPLKGTVLRSLYPEPWMRPSADIDILMRPDAVAGAVEALAAPGWKSGAVGGNYCHIESPSGFHIDLHTSLLKDGGAACPPLEAAWETAVPVREGAAEHRLSDAMFYLFHVYHAAHHMRHGSCGVRAVLDTWLLNHRVDFAAAARRALLEQGGLARFADTLEAVAEAWFSGAPTDARYAEAEQLIFLGGVYLGAHNITAAQASAGGSGAYVLRRVFPSRSLLRAAYPVLDRLPWLLPVCWTHRLFRVLLDGKWNAAQNELRSVGTGDAHARAMAKVFADIGLTDRIGGSS